jgi:hypothetical protein
MSPPRAVVIATNLDWPIIITNVPVSTARPGLWTRAAEFLRGPAFLRIEARNDGTNSTPSTWCYSTGIWCTAEGLGSNTELLRSLIITSAPPGSLVGKIGGSSAGQNDGRVFLAGRFAIVELSSSDRGPLYLTINDSLSDPHTNRSQLLVDIALSPIKEVTSKPEKAQVLKAEPAQAAPQASQAAKKAAAGLPDDPPQ